jgi:hypothetical protein
MTALPSDAGLWRWRLGHRVHRTAVGKVTARAVCWPAKQIYARVYGDAPRLESLLERAGFRTGMNSEFKAPGCSGSKAGDAFVCPYLDMADTVYRRRPHLVIAGYAASSAPAGRPG